MGGSPCLQINCFTPPKRQYVNEVELLVNYIHVDRGLIGSLHLTSMASSLIAGETTRGLQDAHDLCRLAAREVTTRLIETMSFLRHTIVVGANHSRCVNICLIRVRGSQEERLQDPMSMRSSYLDEIPPTTSVHAPIHIRSSILKCQTLQKLMRLQNRSIAGAEFTLRLFLTVNENVAMAFEEKLVRGITEVYRYVCVRGQMCTSLSSCVVALRVRTVMLFPHNNTRHSETVSLRDSNVFNLPHNGEHEATVTRRLCPKYVHVGIEKVFATITRLWGFIVAVPTLFLSSQQTGFQFLLSAI